VAQSLIMLVAYLARSARDNLFKPSLLFCEHGKLWLYTGIPYQSL